jgi:hypothetical protein
MLSVGEGLRDDTLEKESASNGGVVWIVDDQSVGGQR